MEALHFGPNGHGLFGLRFEPRAAPRDTAVLLCGSWGMESMRSYRALSLLGAQLAARGYETLRFDYSCTGDSMGYSGEARLPRWLDDVGAAVGELRQLSAARRICVVGLRLGALLALTAVTRGLRADRVVLWDAPASGAQWVQEVEALDTAYLQRKNLYRAGNHRLKAEREQVLGMPFPAALAEQLQTLTLQTSVPADRLRLILSADASAPPLAHGGELHVPDDGNWIDPAWLTTPWNPGNSLRVIGEQVPGWLA